MIYLYFYLIGAMRTLVPCLLDPVIPKTSLEWTMLADIALTSLVAQLIRWGIFIQRNHFHCRDRHRLSS
ncbi:hypothetical protein DO021_13650 [Desulfobacter hydrogenophilus]|uniref:Uncharacterized protein n=1 Tax=Desulfobacter hydrogenophilus TaxID=2291 RepID=A0A328F9U6_9BACT|nr:hypothetical protein [Desulfobacter hydrogenophilus]NDY72638.1 hypothetical protein [Desulfobacter hydrogenophilus]QBH14542.1 hypothetical protein EYB58_17380 [Desulfobacter hydrogenophilus]RAM01401.1 hypothetical protein DO021_13650 [Desulfobacter hydrogenophilus]